MKKIALLAISTLALGACASNSGSTPTQTHTQTVVRPAVVQNTAPVPSPSAAATQADQVFSCRNGATLTVRYNAGEDKIRLYANTIESSTILSLAPSGSGTRYISENGFYNRPTEFHFKGNSGTFAFQDAYGNAVNTTCKTK